ncbi:MAG: class I SAM-dependent methyltransferase, partial [Isosphaeraceae bacterium]
AGESRSVVVDLCCGIGGDAIALARGGPVLAVDRDAGMTRRARWNAEVHGVSENLLAVRSTAERMPIPAGALVHLDPDRRAGAGAGEDLQNTRRNRPTRAIEDYAPGPAFWTALRSRARGGAIKLSPAADFASAFPDDSGCEVELISLRGECKEAAAWFGDLVEPGCRRRATRLPEGATWSDRDGGQDQDGNIPRPVDVLPPGDFLFDPDPSLIRAGLLDGFARAHGLSRVAGGIDYLTGPDALDSPFLAAFAVEDVAPMDLKHLRRMIVRHDIGALEIKVRGLAVTPESLRARLKPAGNRPATLLIIGPGRGDGPDHQPARAVLASRVTPG